MASSVRRLPLVEQVIAQLRARLAAGELRVGERLPPEPALMAQFGVGRSTIREAVRVLAHAGLLDVRQGEGTFVRASLAEVEPLALKLRRAHVAEVHEVRRALEVEIGRLAAQRRDQADLARLRAALDRRAEGLTRGDVEALLATDAEFHLALARATRNATLAELYATFAAAIAAALRDLVLLAGIRVEHVALHEALFEAVAAGEPDRAEAATRRLLGYIVDSLADPGGARRTDRPGERSRAR
jgi:DNA-binding FadR family transcriptional regulator